MIVTIHPGTARGTVAAPPSKSCGHRMLLCSALFALLVANLTMIMVVQADSYQTMPGNNHTLAKEAKSERGTISTYDGIVLALNAGLGLEANIAKICATALVMVYNFVTRKIFLEGDETK